MENKFSGNPKTALVRPIYKKEDRDKIKNYRPFSFSNGFPKVCERNLHDSLSNFTDKILSKYFPTYRKSYSSNHVIGARLMDLSKASDCIPHDLLAAKLYAYGLLWSIYAAKRGLNEL